MGRRHSIISRCGTCNTDLRRVGQKAGISKHDFVPGARHRHHGGKQRLLDAGSHTDVLFSICSPRPLRMICSNKLSQRGQPGIHRVAVLRLAYAPASLLPNHLGRMEIRLTYAQVDRARSGRIDDPADDALSNVVEPGGGPESDVGWAHRSISSSRTEASVFSSRYLTM